MLVVDLHIDGHRGLGIDKLARCEKLLAGHVEARGHVVAIDISGIDNFHGVHRLFTRVRRGVGEGDADQFLNGGAAVLDQKGRGEGVDLGEKVPVCKKGGGGREVGWKRKMSLSWMYQT